MVTIKIDIREGLIFGARTTVTVARPTLAGALAAVTICLIGRTSLTLAEVLSALRAERATPVKPAGGRVLGDPFRLTRPPDYEHRRHPIDVAVARLARTFAAAPPGQVDVSMDLTPLKPTVAERLQTPTTMPTVAEWLKSQKPPEQPE